MIRLSLVGLEENEETKNSCMFLLFLFWVEEGEGKCFVDKGIFPMIFTGAFLGFKTGNFQMQIIFGWKLVNSF